jgi:hypothetical protein
MSSTLLRYVSTLSSVPLVFLLRDPVHCDLDGRLVVLEQRSRRFLFQTDFRHKITKPFDLTREIRLTKFRRQGTIICCRVSLACQVIAALFIIRSRLPCDLGTVNAESAYPSNTLVSSGFPFPSYLRPRCLVAYPYSKALMRISKCFVLHFVLHLLNTETQYFISIFV